MEARRTTRRIGIALQRLSYKALYTPKKPTASGLYPRFTLACVEPAPRNHLPMSSFFPGLQQHDNR